MVATAIAVGASMHALGVLKVVLDQQSFPWWFWLVYSLAIPGYLLCAGLVLKNLKAGYYLTALGPFIGGLLIFFGFLYPESRLLILIPGTYTTEITLLGFFTLIAEPVASILALFLVANRIWDRV